MVFPSIPVYLDPPNWNQQPSQLPGNGIGTGGSREMELAHQLPPGTVPHQEGGIGAPVRPNSMADRARQLAKLPPPELALKCPRCDSNNTKFCYFNNYSLSQPRHFCKTCRRYWTRGGALRNVPVGGGCRRNKRSKSGGSSSKSQTNSSSTSNATSAIPPSVVTSAQFPFMPSLYPLGEEYGAVPNIGLNFPGIQSSDGMDYHQVAGGGSSSGLEQWRIQQIQQFPFFGALEVQAPAPITGLYPFDGEGSGVDGGGFLGQAHARASTSGLITQMASVKMEDSSLGLNLQRHYMGDPRNDQYWGGGVGGGGSSGGGGWMMDLSGFNSSSPGNQL